jgi:hypothetical protein
MIRVIFEIQEEDRHFTDASRYFEDVAKDANRKLPIPWKYHFKAELITDSIQVGGFG